MQVANLVVPAVVIVYLVDYMVWAYLLLMPCQRCSLLSHKTLFVVFSCDFGLLYLWFPLIFFPAI